MIFKKCIEATADLRYNIESRIYIRFIYYEPQFKCSIIYFLVNTF